MSRKRRICTLCFLLFFICILPQGVSAADTKKDLEYDFNKNKTVSIPKFNSYPESKRYTWLKYKPAADGYLTVEALDLGETDESAKGYLTLYDSSKTRRLSSGTIFYNTANSDKRWRQFVFGLQKGNVYYLRIKSENAAEFTRTFKKIKDVSGATRNKAKKLKKNQTRTGLIPANVSDTDWYQIDLTKKQQLRLFYQAKTNGCFRLTLYYGSKQLKTHNIYYTSGEIKLTIYNRDTYTKKKTGMNAGKYFIKIERANTTSSGFYRIKWN